jgi:hypothetical protein
MPFVAESFNTSKLFSKIVERGIIGMISLFLFKNIPLWLLKMIYKRRECWRGASGGFLERGAIEGYCIATRDFVSPNTEKSKKAVYKKYVATISI